MVFNVVTLFSILRGWVLVANLVDYEVKIVEPQRVITSKISRSLADEVNKRLRRGGARHKILQQVQRALSIVIKTSPTYQELSTPGSELYHELGVLGSKEKLNAILDTWTDSVGVSISPFRVVGTSDIYGVIGIYGIQADYSDVLGMPESSYISTNIDPKSKKKEPYNVPWLEWLLLRGRSFVTPGYVFIRGPQYRPWSRTGDGIMIRMDAKQATKGQGSWQVPSAHAGTSNDNWVTRAIYGKDGGPGIVPHLHMIIKGVLN